MREYIKHSQSIPGHFDALKRICEELELSGEDIPPALTKWRKDVASGRRRRPGRVPRPLRRPVPTDHVPRNLKIQLTIAVLDRLELPPQGSPYSGVGIVKEALKQAEDFEDLSESSVVRIWKDRYWDKPFQSLIDNYSKAIAERTGLSELHTS